jgi:indolepyruvate ferredoxin oxidoreductase
LNPVSNFIFDRDYDFREEAVIGDIKKHVRKDPTQVDFTKLAETVCGDAIATNIMMIGFACQKGLIPLAPETIERAIELNAVAVPANKRAFNWGRKFASDPSEIDAILDKLRPISKEPDTLEEIINKRADFLKNYQDAKYAQSYRDFISKVEIAESKLGKSRDLTNAVARNLFKLMSYKDEYEVARLYTNGEFEKQISETFDGDFKLNYHLAPPIVGFGKKPNGRPRKRAFGPWMMKSFRLLAKYKHLRGTKLDIFGYSAERKMERALIEDYKTTIIGLLGSLNESNRHFASAIARVPDDIRGFGPVKEAAFKKAEAKKQDLLAQFAKPAAKNETGRPTEAEPAE